MKIYDRDYCQLTKEENEEYKKIKEKEIIKKIGTRGLVFRKNLFYEYPKAARHYEHLFPNYYLDILELKDIDTLNKKSDDFNKLLTDECKEQDILKFVKEEEAYFIIASILKRNYHFGHHEAYIIPEFQLGTNYRADYLLIGRSSGGYEFVFVELESPKGNIIKKDGNLGEVFRKGIEQVSDWRRWLQRNYSTLREVYKGYLKPGDQLPSEFIEYDETRIHYAVIAGRRDDFKELTYSIKREYLQSQDILLLHYDNLVDFSIAIAGEATY